MRADEPCPACKRGDHDDCWGVEPPEGVLAIGCPCTHLSHTAR